MGFLGDLAQAFMDYFSTPTGYVSLIIIVITAVIMVIVNYTVPAFGRLIKKSWRAFPMLRRRLEQWWYWKRFGPECSIVPLGKVIVERMPSEKEVDIKYRILFKFKLRCQNRDDMEKLTLDCNWGGKRMVFELRARNVGRRTKPYFLSYKDGDIRWSIPPNEGGERTYLVEGIEDTTPILGETARCKVLYLTYANIGRVGKPIKIKSFNVEVENR